MIVEFSGPSGTGKSTLLSRVAEELRRRGVPAICHDAHGRRDVYGQRQSRWAQFGHRAAAIVTQPRLAVWCGVSMASTRRTGRKRLPRLLRLCRSSRFVRSLRAVPGVHLVDEGPLKIAPAEVKLGGGRAEALLRHLPKPDLVVVVTADAEIARARIRARGDLDTSDAEIDRWIERHSEGADTLRPHVPVLEVDTSGDNDHSVSVADRIVGALEALSGDT